MTARRPGERPLPEEYQAPFRLVGEKVILREKRLDDVEDDYEWRADPELAAFDAVPPLRMSRSDYQRIFERDLQNPFPRQLVLSIEDPETGLHIGNCMFYDYDERRNEAELGIMIGRKEYWGQGYGSDAVATFTRYLFEERNFKRIYLHTLKWNERARKAFQKVGFTPAGEVLRNGYLFILMELFPPEPPELGS